VQDTFSFENLAMFLNLINNVFINQPSNFSTCEEMLDESNEGQRPFGMIDSAGRLTVNTQYDVDRMVKAF
jgi:hypothetical protein